MAKLPMAQKLAQQNQEGGAGSVDNLTKKVQEMRTDDHIRHGRQQGTGGHVTGHRGRGRGRGGHHQQNRAVDVPTTDYDFESANAKFNKEDLVKEAIATGSPLATPGEATSNGLEANGETKEKEKETEKEEVVIPKAAEAVYNRKASFFDNISSELKDKEDRRAGGGQEFRSEERKKNMETFGQGSVDNNYRRGFGRGRGRGFRGGGRGGYGSRGGGRGTYGNNPRGGAQAAES
jgi:protein LSM14